MSTKPDVSTIKCYNCGEMGHYRNDCSKPQKERGNKGSGNGKGKGGQNSGNTQKPSGQQQNSQNGGQPGTSKKVARMAIWDDAIPALTRHAENKDMPVTATDFKAGMNFVLANPGMASGAALVAAMGGASNIACKVPSYRWLLLDILATHVITTQPTISMTTLVDEAITGDELMYFSPAKMAFNKLIWHAAVPEHVRIAGWRAYVDPVTGVTSGITLLVAEMGKAILKPTPSCKVMSTFDLRDLNQFTAVIQFSLQESFVDVKPEGTRITTTPMGVSWMAPLRDYNPITIANQAATGSETHVALAASYMLLFAQKEVFGPDSFRIPVLSLKQERVNDDGTYTIHVFQLLAVWCAAAMSKGVKPDLKGKARVSTTAVMSAADLGWD